MSKRIELPERKFVPIWGDVYTWLMSVPLNRFEYTEHYTFVIEFEHEEHLTEFVLTWL